ncbi:MAG TPA: dienelactone hydrolase family protein [Oleiagrimonas sp.]|nr:dienelactone hydrolase family protein [Oleiagrimonas sp.]
MGQHINIPTTRTQCIGAYLAKAEGKSKGGIVVIQEIYGVTPHIRSVADRLAAAGYTAVTPAFFDHLESGVELDYDKAGTGRGKALVQELGMQRPMEDVASAAEAIASAGKIGTIGFCWGGTVALLAAQHLGMPSVSYYGARNTGYMNDPLQAPVMFHFGENDRSIPPEAVARHREQWPDMEVFTYPDAGHAFNRDVEGDPHYHEASAELAWQRTLAFFGQHL